MAADRNHPQSAGPGGDDPGRSSEAALPVSAGTLLYGLYAACAVLLLVDLVLDRHGYFEIEHVPGFYAICGFVGSAVFVIAAKLMGAVLARPEDYYDDE